MNRFAFAILASLSVIAFSCNQPTDEPSEETVVDTIPEKKESQVDIFYEHTKEKNYIVDIDTAIINKFGGEQMKAIAWSGPMRISDENGTYHLEGITDVVNFDIDPDCSNKFFRFKLPIDSVLPYLSQSKYSSSYFFSWGEIFDTTAKRFVKEEIWHRGEHNKVIAELQDFNIHYAIEGLDSLQILRFFPRDVFDKEFEIEAWVVNNSKTTIDEANFILTITEFKDNKSKEVVSKTTHEKLNILPSPIPPRTFQIVRAKFKNKHYKPSAEIKLVYYDAEKTFKNFKVNGEVITLDKVIK